MKDIVTKDRLMSAIPGGKSQAVKGWIRSCDAWEQEVREEWSRLVIDKAIQKINENEIFDSGDRVGDGDNSPADV